MIIRITLKDPDGFSNSVDEAVREEIAKLGLDEDDADAVFETRIEKVWKKLEKFVEYQEYVTLEFDTETGTAKVVSRK